MKKILFLLVILGIHLGLYSQVEIPKKMLKGIDSEIDEFTNTKTYYSKGECLSIEINGDSVALYVSLSCSTWDSPIELKKIYILVDGKTTIIDHNEKEFIHKEQSDRFMKKPASGAFGTSSYKPAVFESRMKHTDTWKSNARQHMELINAMIMKGAGKMKFEGTNQSLTQELDKKNISRIKSILDLYTYLKSNL